MMASAFTSRSSTFIGSSRSLRVSPFTSTMMAPRQSLLVSAKKVCELTGVKRNKANTVSFSNKHTRKFQDPNLQEKKIFWEHGARWVKLKVCTRALKTINKNGIDGMAAEAGIDLWKLPFVDARPQRLAYLAANPRKVPVAKNPRAMKNKVKLAASKVPRYPVYEQGGRIIWIKPGQEESVLGQLSDAQAMGEARAAAQKARSEAASLELKVTISGEDAPAAAAAPAPAAQE